MDGQTCDGFWTISVKLEWRRLLTGQQRIQMAVVYVSCLSIVECEREKNMGDNFSWNRKKHNRPVVATVSFGTLPLYKVTVIPSLLSART